VLRGRRRTQESPHRKHWPNNKTLINIYFN